MNKAEFTKFIATEQSITQADAERIIDAFINGITNALGTKEQRVDLIGFGSFKVQNRQARKGRNPKTAEPIDIPAYNQPIFKAGKKLKDACNDRKAPTPTKRK